MFSIFTGDDCFAVGVPVEFAQLLLIEFSTDVHNYNITKQFNALFTKDEILENIQN